MKIVSHMGESEAARHLGYTRRRMPQLVREGRLHPVETPIGRLYPIAEIERLRRRRAVTRALAKLRGRRA